MKTASMKTFCELITDVLYMSDAEACGIAVLPRGRIVVLAEENPERQTRRVLSVGADGKPVRLWVPAECVRVLGAAPKGKSARDRVYVGEITAGEHRVTVFPLGDDGAVSDAPYLLPCPRRHSHGGLGWGYDGDGPADLALALLRDCAQVLNTDAEARRALVETYYMDFRREFVEVQPQDGRWSTTGRDILERLQRIMDAAGAHKGVDIVQFS